jgi:uncharacterized membrane protein
VLDRLFRLGVWIKGIDGILEIVGGVALALVDPTRLDQLAMFLTQRELGGGTGDRIATLLHTLVQHLSSRTVLFGCVYLLGHGVAKVILMIGLLKNLRWAYPTAEIFLLVFIGYEAYRLSVQYSLPLLAVLLLDTMVLVLVWREQRQRWGPATTGTSARPL